MKITVIKKASSAKPSGYCPVYVDDIADGQEVTPASSARIPRQHNCSLGAQHEDHRHQEGLERETDRLLPRLRRRHRRWARSRHDFDPVIDGRSRLALDEQLSCPAGGAAPARQWPGVIVPSTRSHRNRAPTTLTVGFGLATRRDAGAGIEDTVRSLALERLVIFSNDGRPQARLAEKWELSARRSDPPAVAATGRHVSRRTTGHRGGGSRCDRRSLPPSTRSDSDVRQISRRTATSTKSRSR